MLKVGHNGNGILYLFPDFELEQMGFISELSLRISRLAIRQSSPKNCSISTLIQYEKITIPKLEIIEHMSRVVSPKEPLLLPRP